MPPVSAVGTLPLATQGPATPGDAFDARLLTFRARAADQAHAAFTPGTTWPVIGTPARPITGEQPDLPLSMPPRFVLTTPQQRTPTPRTSGRTLSGTSSWSPPDASSAPSPRSLTTTVFSQRSTGWFGALPRRTTPEGQQASISSTAPPMKDASYMTSSSAFVTHGCRTKPRRGRWIVSKRGLRNRPPRPSRAAGPSRGGPARRLWRALPPARSAFSQPALCDSLRPNRASAATVARRSLFAPSECLRRDARNARSGLRRRPP
jgi:hypothetical protein